MVYLSYGKVKRKKYIIENIIYNSKNKTSSYKRYE
jgi:hypothetical protein